MRTSRAVRKVNPLKLLSEIPALIESKWCGFNMSEASGNIGDSALPFTNNDTTAFFANGLQLDGTATNAYDNRGFLTTNGADFELQNPDGGSVFTVGSPQLTSFMDLRTLVSALSGHFIVAYGGKFSTITAEEVLFDMRGQWFFRHNESVPNKPQVSLRYNGGSSTVFHSSAPAVAMFDGSFRHVLLDMNFTNRIATQYIDGNPDPQVMADAVLDNLDAPATGPFPNLISFLGTRTSSAIVRNIGLNSALPVQLGYFYLIRVDGKDVSASMQDIADGFMKNSGEIPYEMEGI